MKKHRKMLVAATGIALCIPLMTFAWVIAPASATPGSGFAPTSIARGHYGALDVKAEKDSSTDKWDMQLKTKDDTIFNIDKLTVVPGGQSGWHAHPAPVFATVTLGEIQWYDGTDPLCGWKTLNVGDSFIEGAYEPHLVRNATGAPAEFIAVSIAPAQAAVPPPAGIGFRLDRPKPTNCPF